MWRRSLLLLPILRVIIGADAADNITWHRGPRLPAALRSSIREETFEKRAEDRLTELNVTDTVRLRFKEPNICETTQGVRSYSGYVDLDEGLHLFFWFFEARNEAETAPITLWLNGGPGSDSLIGLLNGSPSLLSS